MSDGGSTRFISIILVTSGLSQNQLREKRMVHKVGIAADTSRPSIDPATRRPIRFKSQTCSKPHSRISQFQTSQADIKLY